MSLDPMTGVAPPPRCDAWRQWQSAPVDVSTLIAFRLLFGAIMCVDVVVFWVLVDTEFPAWEFRPTYRLFRFAEAWPRPDLNFLFFGMLLTSASLTIGLYTRVAAGLLTALFAYVFLYDPTQFNNHFYLITLLALCLAVVKSNGQLSIDARLRPAVRSTFVPRWHLALLQAHLGLAYFYGGLAKLNGDWLRGEPMRIWLAVEEHTPVIGPWLAHPWAGVVFAWGGLIFDLVIPFALLWKRTRPYAIVVSIAFHLTNSWLFDIGVFPWMMVASTVVFLEPDTPRRWFRALFGPAERSSSNIVPASRRQRWVATALALYAVCHLVVPFRHVLDSDNVEWTETGKNFSWRMMLSHKDTFVRIFIGDPDTGRVFEVDQSRHLSGRQRRGKGVWGNPRLLAAYARYLAREAQKAGIRNPDIRADAIASLNGRPYQYLVDPDINLAKADDPWFGTPAWVVPLKPNQPIGQYALTREDKLQRVQAVIDEHRARQQSEPTSRHASL